MEEANKNTKSQNQKLWVCMPFYNSSTYVDEAIKSIKNQTYTNWHLLIANDGSNIKELNKLKKCLSIIPGKYTLLNSVHKGSFSARWRMWDTVTDGIIVNIDADDYFCSNKAFDYIVKAFKKYDSDMVIYKQIRKVKNLKCNSKTNSDLKLLTLKKEDYQKTFFTTVTQNFIHNKAFKYNICKNINCNKDENLSFAEDRYLTALLLFNTKKIIYIDKPIYLYRKNRHSQTTKTYSFDIFYNEIFVEKQIHKIIKNLGIDYYNKNQRIHMIIYYSLYRIFMDNYNYQEKEKRSKVLRNIPITDEFLNKKFKRLLFYRKITLYLYKQENYSILKLVFLLNKIITKCFLFIKTLL